ncbi:MAG TPA: methyltransferase [Spirochaetia bacterium]|nr:methyltransferase [Spirochaetia bacterium]
MSSRSRTPPGPGDAQGIQRFINKTVPLRFLGEDLQVSLSHGLFSSFDVDDGTRLLLKSLAQRVDLASLESALDVGCGVGVIGMCVGRHAPRARLLLQDRDALAAAVARLNCAANGLAAAEVECALGFHGLSEQVFDLVVSNIPAKAGAPVLHAFFRHAAGCLSARGLAAVVIVAPLASMARRTIQELGCVLVHSEDTAAYSVFHFTTGSAPRETDDQREDLSPYIRTTARFALGSAEVVLETAHALASFDTLGHDLELALDVLDETAAQLFPAVAGDDGSDPARTVLSGSSDGRSVLLWNPGQGHLALAAAAAAGRSASVSIASRDCLECAMTARNLAAQGTRLGGVHRLPSEVELASAAPAGSVDLLVAVPRPIPRVPWQRDLVESARRVLKPGGSLLVVATSTEIHRLREQSRGLALTATRKRGGLRAVVLTRTVQP